MSPIASSRFFTSSCMRALAAGGKCFSTYFFPSASPSSASVDSAQRFQRGFISAAPAEVLLVEGEVLLRRRARRATAAAEWSRCQRRYAFQSASGVSSEQPVERLHELRLLHVERRPAAASPREVRRPVEDRREVRRARRRSSCGRWPSGRAAPRCRATPPRAASRWRRRRPRACRASRRGSPRRARACARRARGTSRAPP